MASMKTDEIKALKDVLNELCDGYADLLKAIKGTEASVKAMRGLWRNKASSKLMKLGLALIAFPEPVISEAIGSLLITIGVLREAIKRHALYADDVPKAFKELFASLMAVESSF